jgi:hypothetical protein
LRSASDDTPGSRRAQRTHPGGIQDDPDSISEKRLHKISDDALETSAFESSSILVPDRLVCHPSGMKNDLFSFRYPGVSLRSTPG